MEWQYSFHNECGQQCCGDLQIHLNSLHLFYFLRFCLKLVSCQICTTCSVKSNVLVICPSSCTIILSISVDMAHAINAISCLAVLCYPNITGMLWKQWGPIAQFFMSSQKGPAPVYSSVTFRGSDHIINQRWQASCFKPRGCPKPGLSYVVPLPHVAMELSHIPSAGIQMNNPDTVSEWDGNRQRARERENGDPYLAFSKLLSMELICRSSAKCSTLHMNVWVYYTVCVWTCMNMGVRVLCKQLSVNVGLQSQLWDKVMKGLVWLNYPQSLAHIPFCLSQPCQFYNYAFPLDSLGVKSTVTFSTAIYPMLFQICLHTFSEVHELTWGFQTCTSTVGDLEYFFPCLPQVIGVDWQLGSMPLFRQGSLRMSG